MKIDELLKRHPLPWRVRELVSKHRSGKLYTRSWQVEDAQGCCVFDDGSCGGEVIYACNAETRDAILELVEAHVNEKSKVVTYGIHQVW